MLISICIPCYKSNEALNNLAEKIDALFSEKAEYDYELVLVNDGSPDKTFERITELCKQNPKIKGIDLAKNFGQNVATMAALKNASGDIAVIMDDDGQHNPEYIFALIDKINEGFDVVYGHLRHKKHNLFKRTTSRMYWSIAEWERTKPKNIALSAFAAYNTLALDYLKQYDSPFPSTTAYLMSATAKFANIDVEHLEREDGRSGYTVKKLFSLWLTTFTSFSITPLRIASVIGAVLSVFALLFGIYLLIHKLVDPSVPAGYTSLIATVVFIGGVLMLMLGLIGEYIGRIYMIISKQPQYIVRTKINFNDGK